MNNSVAIAIIVCATILVSIFLLNNNKLPYNIPPETIKFQEEEAESAGYKKNISGISTEEETKSEKGDPSIPPNFMSNAHKKKEKIVSKDGKTIATDDAAAVVNWAHRYIEVTGTGISPVDCESRFQKLELAKEGAVANAYRRLAESLSDVVVKGVTNIKKKVVREHFTGIIVENEIKGAFPIGSYECKEDPMDGAIQCTVKYGYALDGDKGLLSYIRKNPDFFEEKVIKTETFKPNKEKDAEEIKIVKEKKYSGLIINCSKFNIIPKATLSIKTIDGSNSFNLFKPNPKKYADGTAARYIESIDLALKLKTSNRKLVAGDNPLILKAVNVINNNPVISRSDAVKVFQLNKDISILTSGNTIIIY